MQAHSPQIEGRIRRLGREIFERALSSAPTLFQPEWWQQKILEWAMQDKELRVGLFRFVDVLPSLRTGREVAEHLQEYLLNKQGHLPAPLDLGLRISTPGSVAGRVAALAARRNVRQLARRFIAGETLEEAVTSVQRLRKQRLSFTVDVLGEATTSEAQADAYAQQYVDLITRLSDVAKKWNPVPQIDEGANGFAPRVNVSLKLSSLDSQFDAVAPARAIEAVGRRLRPLLRLARERNAFVYVDMEHYAYKDLILQAFKSLLMEDEFRDFPHAGTVIQAYLRESEQDLRDLLGWVRGRGCPIAVRLVKGAYWDQEVVRAAQRGWPCPVFTQKWESDAKFEQLARTLLEHHRYVLPAFGSHNVRSLAAAMVLAEDLGAPSNAFEIQMLFGMGDPLKTALVGRGYRVRVYTPYGPLLPGMSYLIRRLLENTSNDSFLRQSFSEHVPIDELLVDPLDARASGPAPASPDANTIGSSAPALTDSRKDLRHTVPPLGKGGSGGICERDEESPSIPLFQRGKSNAVRESIRFGDSASDRRQGNAMSDFKNEPWADFSLESNRSAMSAALREVRERCGGTYPLIIGGRQIATAETMESRDPSTPSFLVGRVARATVDDAERAVEAALMVWPTWRRTPVSERAGVLRRLAERMRRRRFELAAWIIIETGKPWRGADADVTEAIDFCEFYAREMERLDQQPRQRDVPGEENVLIYEPRGVTVVISPWNFPLAILTGMMAAALVAGNTVVVKPAEQSSVVAAKLFGMLGEIGLPDGVANFLSGIGEEVGAHLIQHPDVALIAFTGSRKVGLSIIEAASRTPLGQRHLKKVVAEMGGKNAIIIDSDADLDEAVLGVTESAFGYAGQKCSACSRVIVLSGVHTAFMKRLIDATRSLHIGRADDPATFVGSLIDAEAKERVTSCIQRGKGEAKIVCQVNVAEAEGHFVGPVIFDRVPRQSFLAQEEIFGPVLAVLIARDFDDALSIANDSDYALTGGVYSRSPSHIEQAKRDLRVGNLYINRPITGALVDRQPFGGFKLSGIGSKAGGPDYLLQFCEPKTITENTMRHGFAPATVT